MQPVKEKENFEFKSALLPLKEREKKLTLCHILLIVDVLGKYIHAYINTVLIY